MTTATRPVATATVTLPLDQLDVLVDAAVAYEVEHEDDDYAEQRDQARVARAAAETLTDARRRLARLSGTPHGRRLTVRDALQASPVTEYLYRHDNQAALDAAHIAVRALDDYADTPPPVNAGEAARRLSEAVTAVLAPYRAVLTDLGQHIEPTPEQADAIEAIHTVLRDATELARGMADAARPLNRLGIEIPAAY